MSVARFSCPQLLDLPLRTAQQWVNVEAVGVGCYRRRDPAGEPHKGPRQRLPKPELALEIRQRYLHLLPLAAVPRAFRHQQDAGLGQGFLQRLASVGQIPKEPACEAILLPEVRLGEHLLGKPDLGDVSGGERVGDGHPVGSTYEVQLQPVDREGAPPHPDPQLSESTELPELRFLALLTEGGAERLELVRR
jgi:hypothetical protein